MTTHPTAEALAVARALRRLPNLYFSGAQDGTAFEDSCRSAHLHNLAADLASGRIALPPVAITDRGFNRDLLRTCVETDDPDAILTAADAVLALYDHDEMGGRLHIVVDDWNVDDHSLKFCADLFQTEAAEDAATEIAETQALEALRPLSEDGRMAALLLVRARKHGRELDASEREWLAEGCPDE